MTIWISDHDLSDDQMIENAQYVLDYLSSFSWTKEAICGIMGNMARESKINPGLWEYPSTQTGAYGIVQWDSAYNYIDWAIANGLEVENMTSQLMRIKWEFDNHEQFYPSDESPMTFSQFVTSTQSPENLAKIFCWNYERAGVEAMSERIEWANYFYAVLSVGFSHTTPPVSRLPYRKPLKFILRKRYRLRY